MGIGEIYTLDTLHGAWSAKQLLNLGEEKWISPYHKLHCLGDNLPQQAFILLIVTLPEKVDQWPGWKGIQELIKKFNSEGKSFSQGFREKWRCLALELKQKSKEVYLLFVRENDVLLEGLNLGAK